jgi:hypothetical protein
MKNRSVFSGIQMKWKPVLVGMVCLSMATGVSAEQNAKPCADDAARLCKGMQQGEGRIAKCMKEHESELSPGCKENIGKMKEKVQDFKEACKDDAAKLCKDTKPGGGRILQCLKQHEGELSAACKETMKQAKGRKQ